MARCPGMMKGEVGFSSCCRVIREQGSAGHVAKCSTSGLDERLLQVDHNM